MNPVKVLCGILLLILLAHCRRDDPAAAGNTFQQAPFTDSIFTLILGDSSFDIDRGTTRGDGIDNISDLRFTDTLDVTIDKRPFKLFVPAEELQGSGFMMDDVPGVLLREVLDRDKGTLSDYLLIVNDASLYSFASGGSTIFTPRDDRPPAQTKSMGFGDLLRERMRARDSLRVGSD
ncbi:hypothetical protein [Neolewinella litorea]|uniref:Uncharacterized protein n=1 Tax=Neolewinella litorea TaxID=2562452 RepID=A0A4V3XL77_9BACT|nr:hypothetical protein [Neolewinella litorea]THH39783.1 hypothetical protein E4021_09215 [Neolewinella litorea]